ncbi:MAG: hypothetical protein ACI9JN_002133, partial [Bacteroidia bacterium]
MKAQKLLKNLYEKGIALSLDGESLLIDADECILDDETLATIKDNKENIVSDLKILSGGRKAALLVTPRSLPYECVPSLAQKRMLFVENLAGKESFYNIPTAFELSGKLDIERLEESLRFLVDTHDILRTLFRQKGNDVVQYVCEKTEFASHYFKVKKINLSHRSEQRAELKKDLAENAHYKFKLEEEWPVKLSLFVLSEEIHVLSITLHHIAADGWSARKLIEDICKQYSSLDLSKGTATKNLLQYADYVDNEKQWLNSQNFLDAKKYWLTHLTDLPQLHSLPTDFIRPKVQSVRGKRYQLGMTTLAIDLLKRRSQEFSTTPFIIIQSVFAAFLSRLSGESDVAFGTAFANRLPADFSNTIGLFVNTLVMRHFVEPRRTFRELVSAAKSINQQARYFQQFPFDILVEELQPKRSLGFNPLVQIMLVMQQDNVAHFDLEGLKVHELDNFQGVSKFDLALHFKLDGDTSVLQWEYKVDLFKAETIERMAQHFVTFFSQYLDDPDMRIGDIELVNRSDTQVKEIVSSNYHTAQCVHQLFETHVQNTPTAIAIRQGSENLNYLDLANSANNLATHLKMLTKGKKVRIGLCMEKSVNLVKGMLAIFKAGCIYVPLDPHYPKERLDYMIEDSNIQIILTSGSTALLECFSKFALIIDVETISESEEASAPLSLCDLTDMAYIIYTSGSTGKPKGVLVSHESLFFSLMANQEQFGISSNDIIPTIGSQAFGISLLEILLPL